MLEFNNNENVIVSIVVPVYNTSKYLDECLSSLVNQTFRNIEIICVNDGSTDSSLEILRKWEDKDKRVIIIDSKVNHRQGWARNQAIKIAKGKYIGLVDSDDYVSENMYESLLENSDNFTADLVFSDLYATHSNVIIKRYQFVPRIYGIDDVKKMAIVKGCHMCTNIIKKDLFEKYNLWYPEHILYEDNANRAALILVANKIKICYNNAPFYFYRINNQSTMRSVDNKHHWDRLITARLFLEHTKRFNLYENFKSEIDYSYYLLFVQNSFMFAIFSFSNYQNKKVKEIIVEYENLIGIKRIKENQYYKINQSFSKKMTELIYYHPRLGYFIWAYSYCKRRLRLLFHH